MKSVQEIMDMMWEGRAKGYTYNGCTASPDLDFGMCCNRHDHHYQDLELTRWQSDKLLAKCMWNKSWKGKVLAPVYWIAVRVAGGSHFKRKQNEAIARVGTPDDPNYDMRA